MESQIFQVIDEMEEYISNCKGKFMSSTEIICNRDKMEEFLRDLRRKAPDEIDKCRKIIARQEAIYSDAKVRAQKLLDESAIQSDELVSQNEIMKRAYAQADEVVALAQKQAQNVVDNAIIEANEYRNGAAQYMEDVMVYLENFFNASSKEINDNYTKLINSINSYAERIHEDHLSLHQDEPEEIPVEAAAPASEEQ